MAAMKFRVTSSIVLTLTLLRACSCQQNAPLFNQSPFNQRQQLRQQFPQQFAQQQRQQGFPNVLNTLNPLTPPLASTLNPITPLSPIVPTNPYRAYSQINAQNYVPITAYQNELNYDGSFAYGYATADGTTAQAQGYVKNLGLGEAVEAQVVQGSYSYTSPEGTPITVRYIADENGFRAEGAHIPTPPPIPDAIAKSLLYNGNAQQYQQNTLNPNLNPYQTPYRQYPQAPNFRQGQQLTPLQLQQQQRFLQQNSGQYQPDSQYGAPQLVAGSFGATGLQRQYPQGQFPQAQFAPGQFPQFPQGQQYAPNQVNAFGARLNPQQQQQQNIAQHQQQQQQQQNLQNKQQQAQNEQQQQQGEQQQQQQLATQELRARSNQLVSSFGLNQYRRYKKATNK